MKNLERVVLVIFHLGIFWKSTTNHTKELKYLQQVTLPKKINTSLKSSNIKQYVSE